MIVGSVIVTALLAGCGTTTDMSTTSQTVSGGRSALVSIDRIIAVSTRNSMQRRAALLGVFIAEYISFAETANAAQGALNGIATDAVLTMKQNSVTDPDFDLLQAFADALQVDVSDLLNRSQDRQQSLDTYVTALTNVGARANERYGALSRTDDELKSLLRTESKERSDAERALQSAIKLKEFSQAGELQKTVLEKQRVYAETDLKRKQVEDVASTLNSLLTLYQSKIVAIEQNREILIAGNRIVDVPGIEELKIIERTKASRTTGRGAGAFDSLFQGTGLK